MTAKIPVSNDLPAPTLAADVLRLQGRKASATLPSGLGEELLNQPPKMEEFDGRWYPKGPEAMAVSVLTAAEMGKALSASTDAYIPEHADVDYVARLEPRSMRRPKFIERSTFVGNTMSGRTIFGPEDRKVFYSTAYPWRCNGKVESALGSGSGVMVGPRHLLTCSHIIDWRPDGSVGWLKFTPMYYNGSVPISRDGHGLHYKPL